MKKPEITVARVKGAISLVVTVEGLLAAGAHGLARAEKRGDLKATAALIREQRHTLKFLARLLKSA